MKLSSATTIFLAAAFFCASLFAPQLLDAQTHRSVPVDDQVYLILEQAQMRGLCAPLSGSRPYSQNVIISAINEILDNEGVKNTEREILERCLAKYGKPQTGMDWKRGAFFGETSLGKRQMPFTANAGASLDMEGSGGIYPSSDEYFIGMEVWAQIYLNGDIGNNFSYDFDIAGGLLKVPRKSIGNGNTYYAGFPGYDESDKDTYQYHNRNNPAYSEPLTHFPYSYKKPWDGSVFFLSNLSSLDYWPGGVSGAYSLLSELSASFLNDKLMFRLGRLSREWGQVPAGSSLALNQMARPFLGMEAEFAPFSWFGISSLTGVLEYHNTEGERKSSRNSQNAYSVTMMQFRIKNYFFFDFVDSIVWPKRFELGYISPITNNFFYQNNIGDYDNIAMAFNLKAQYPGLGNIWFSLFIDEIKLNTHFWDLDRTMTAGQAGLNIALPFLSFSSIRMSYTKINPYCYTHNRNFNPWYGNDLTMESSYTNNGASLGYYLPPNSDEILFRFQTMPTSSLTTVFQFQMIRHGAAYGSGEVDGSSLLSELDTDGRDGSNPILKRFFLKDGAYQWMYIIRAGADWHLPGLPVSLYGEAGAVISYFTNTKEPANSGAAYNYSIIDTAEYPKATGFVVKLGVKIYPR